MKLRLFAATWFAFTCATPSTAQTFADDQREAGSRSERLTAWTHPTFPVAEYQARRSRARALLGANDVLVVPSAEGTSGGDTFRQLDDFEYLVGLELPRSTLVIDGQSGQSLLFVPRNDPRFENRARPNDFPGRPLVQDPALRALSGVDSVLPDDALPAFLARASTRSARMLAHTDRIDDAYTIMATLRMAKSVREIASLREAARMTSVAIARGAAQITAGVDERTLTGKFIADCMTLGAQRSAFAPIIKSGPNSLWPWRILGAHYDRRNRAMARGELVIFDVGCERDHYVSDVGRTFPVSERFSPRQRELVEMVRAISDAVIAAARPGVTLSALQRVAANTIPTAAKPYMQAPLYFGHHIGLDAGDPSLADAVLREGMVFTIEPWYYNHDEQVAVFLEDEILITASGSENLTAGLPRDADGLERMRQGRAASLTDASAGRTMTRDGVLSFALDRRAATVRVYDLLNGVDAAVTPVCANATRAALSHDDISFVVHCGTAAKKEFVNTASYAIAEATSSRVPSTRAARTVARKNEVLVVGTIHVEHRTSRRYSTTVLRQLLTAMRPDYVLTEIAPNRFDAAMREFSRTGNITEPRVVRFPEYVDVLFPLTRTLPFTIVPTAGWSRPMDMYRTAALKRIESDASRREEWRAYQQAEHRADSLVALHGADNPYFINSALYDSIQTDAHEPYNRLFNSELGPGGWDNINVAHFQNISQTLDQHRGEGRRFVITYGAGHKEWMLRELKKRDDITLLDVAPFLERIGAKRQ
ncbi:MAG: Xaa-Pro peptidase family protein [Gemmatimonadaceae bacterium]